MGTKYNAQVNVPKTQPKAIGYPPVNKINYKMVLIKFLLIKAIFEIEIPLGQTASHSA